MSGSESPKDVFSEALEDPLNDPGGARGVPEKSPSDPKGAARVEVDPFADPLGKSGAQPGLEKNRTPLPNLGEAPPKGKGLEVFDAPQNDVKKFEDIFEEPPKDGTTKPAPKPAGGKKAPSTDLFGDDDDGDLFEEPFQATVKNPQAKEGAKGRPDQSKDVTTDLFTEDVIRVPPAAAAAAKPAKPGTDPGSKSNGLHSDDDDLFTGTLSLL